MSIYGQIIILLACYRVVITFASLALEGVHKSLGLSRKFWSSKNFGLGPFFQEKLVWVGPIFLKKRSAFENFGPGVLFA